MPKAIILLPALTLSFFLLGVSVWGVTGDHISIHMPYPSQIDQGWQTEEKRGKEKIIDL